MFQVRVPEPDTKSRTVKEGLLWSLGQEQWFVLHLQWMGEPICWL
jgi:hypothetical protein